MLSSSIFSTCWIASSIGTEGYNAFTSNDTITSLDPSWMFSNSYLVWYEFFSFLSDKLVKGVRILDRNLDSSYEADSMKDTMGLIG